jgi:hypothetical protein
MNRSVRPGKPMMNFNYQNKDLRLSKQGDKTALNNTPSIGHVNVVPSLANGKSFIY